MRSISSREVICARVRVVTHSTKLEKNEENVAVHGEEELLGEF